MTSDVTSGETFSCVSEEIFPLALKSRVFRRVLQSWDFLCNDFLPEIFLEPKAPGAQRAGIVWRPMRTVKKGENHGTYEQRGFRRSRV